MPKSFRIFLLVAIVLCMALIFSFSMETASESTETSDGFIRTLLETFDGGFGDLSPAEQLVKVRSFSHFARKTAHFSIFGVLGLLVASAVSAYRLGLRKTVGISLVVCALYAVSDEVHQYFVSGRACMVRDMLLDTCGACCGIALVCLLLYIRRTRREN